MKYMFFLLAFLLSFFFILFSFLSLSLSLHQRVVASFPFSLVSNIEKYLFSIMKTNFSKKDFFKLHFWGGKSLLASSLYRFIRSFMCGAFNSGRPVFIAYCLENNIKKFDLNLKSSLDQFFANSMDSSRTDEMLNKL